MSDTFRLTFAGVRAVLEERLAEQAPGRVQLVTGPRQVGKTTLLLDVAEHHAPSIYVAADAPEAALPGAWDRVWAEAEAKATEAGRAVVLLDEVHRFPDWAARLKAVWDRYRRHRTPIHVLATGSSALRLAAGSRESLAGRFERLTLGHWPAAALAETFGVPPADAAQILVRFGAYPGAFALRGDVARWKAYVRDSIVEPAVGRDILSLAPVRRPALLRQVFAVAASAPAQILALQKIRGQLTDAGALETIAHYLELLEEAYLVAALPKYSTVPLRRRAAPPKLVTLSNAILAVADPRGIPEPGSEPDRFGAWLENACLAHAWNAGQRVMYWREEPLEVDGVLEGSWGAWAVEVKSGYFGQGDLVGLLEFTRRNRKFRPLVVCDESGIATARRAGVAATTWQQFLLGGPESALAT